VEREREQGCEIQELRATLDTVWKKYASRPGSHPAKDGAEQPPETTRAAADAEPNMDKVLKEIVNYSVHLRQLIAEEREHRLTDQQQLASLAKQTQALQKAVQALKSSQRQQHPEQTLA